MQEQQLRRTGLSPIGDLPWGSHVCLFYETPQDLLDVHVDYFGTGLEDGDFCLWALSGPFQSNEAVDELRRWIPGFDHHLSAGHIELVPGYEWYLPGNREVDPDAIVRRWYERLDDALARGFGGLRVSGNAFWFETGLWKAFSEYEAYLNRSLSGKKMIALCTYALGESRAADILDVTKVHNFSLARRSGEWELLETPEVARARREIARLNDALGILSGPFPGHKLLTPRERATLGQIVKGASSKEAARSLEVSPRTVDFHRANIIRKLGVHNVAELLSKVLGSR